MAEHDDASAAGTQETPVDAVASDAVEQPPRRYGSQIWRIAQYALFAGVLLVVARHVGQNLDDLKDVPAPHPVWFLLSVPLLTAGLLGFSTAGWLLLRWQGEHVGFGPSVGLLYVPMLGKYLPGRVWTFVGAFWIYERLGVGRHAAAVTILLSTPLTGVSGLIIAIAFSLQDVLTLVSGWVLIGGLAGMLLVVHPRVMTFLVRRGFRRLRLEPAVETTRLSTWQVAVAVVLNALSWIVFGLGFASLAQSLGEIPPTAVPPLVGLFAFAQIAGFLAVFSPAGIGVREAVFLIGLAPLIGDGGAIAVAAWCRLLQTIVELALAGVGWHAVRQSERAAARAAAPSADHF